MTTTIKIDQHVEIRTGGFCYPGNQRVVAYGFERQPTENAGFALCATTPDGGYHIHLVIPARAALEALLESHREIADEILAKRRRWGGDLGANQPGR